MEAKEIIRRARAAGRPSLTEAEGKALLAAHGIPVPRSVVLANASEVEAAIAPLRPPLVLKVMSPQLLHKSDVGGVAVGLADAAAVREAMERMAAAPAIAQARVEGFLVEEMAPAGREVVVGGLRDACFGPMLMVGLGGIFVEILEDVAFRLCPITAGDARAMLEELKGIALLKGVRGEAGVALDKLEALLLRVGGEHGLLMTHAAHIGELDINPVIVSQTGAVAADARVLLGAAGQAGDMAGQAGDTAASQRRPRDDLPVGERFRPLFEPETIAVVGASASRTTVANTFLRRLKAFGFKGEVYPIHPSALEIEGLPTRPSLAATPKAVDYAYIAVGARQTPGLLAEAGGNVRFAQVISSGFREVADGEALERELVAKAHGAGCRVIGPNCLGLYSPRGGVTFPDDAPTETGHVGVISQSGGLGTDIIKRGQWRGLRFSALVTVGNSADVGPADMLEYYFDDPQTRAVGCYLEDVRDGRRFFNLLRSAKATKPVVLLVGGLSRQGRAAAASHTGALAGDHRAWHALVRQTPSVLVTTVDDFVDTLLALQQLSLKPSRPTRQVALFGNGGGSGVLATDGFAAVGLDVSPFPDAARAKLEALQLPPGTSIINPIDTPVGTLQQQEGRVANTILDIVYSLAKPDAVVMHLNLAAFVGRGMVDPVGNLIQAAVDIQEAHPGQAHFMLALRVDGSPVLDEAKRKYTRLALAAGIPVYDEIADTARVLAAVRHLEERMADHMTDGMTEGITGR